VSGPVWFFGWPRDELVAAILSDWLDRSSGRPVAEVFESSEFGYPAGWAYRRPDGSVVTSEDEQAWTEEEAEEIARAAGFDVVRGYAPDAFCSQPGTLRRAPDDELVLLFAWLKIRCADADADERCARIVAEISRRQAAGKWGDRNNLAIGAFSLKRPA